MQDSSLHSSEWIKINAELPDNVIIEPDRLIIAHLEKGSGGRYKCMSVDGEGTHITKFFNLVNLYEPKAEIYPKWLKRTVGASASFKCFGAYTPDFTIAWSRSNGQNLDVNGDTLTLNDITTEDEDSYECIIENEFGQSRATAQLFVVNLHDDEGERIAEYKQIELHNELQLACPAAQNVEWTKVESDLPHHAFIEDGKLLISRVDEEDGGMYRCRSQDDMLTKYFDVTVIC
ncbi:hypothetical protein HELRODRAFT_158989 [Helobdella robusta]|uniref:Ig-like domain-containing protein n=1 Tax=Helobdella robusta TaxID=6412 RepID=T1ENG4_HELRO|nr:hypothetical protein HELRODRAFT_158989 [Helobdella robusta]ESO12455.1 hypothetical protein HELRODRAFT_158989 [Helobdella robusta]